jgi:S1-C subfamily serine protease
LRRKSHFWRPGGNCLPARSTATSRRLIAAGIDPIDAAEIAAAVDKITLDRLRLRYETARNGDLGSTKYREALAEIPNPREFVQEQYGDDAYDSYLYASGRPNRVIVTDVLQESPAHQIGLQAGDVLISLDDQRIYSSRDIMSIASASAGSVPLILKGNNQSTDQKRTLSTLQPCNAATPNTTPRKSLLRQCSTNPRGYGIEPCAVLN